MHPYDDTLTPVHYGCGGMTEVIDKESTYRAAAGDVARFTLQCECHSRCDVELATRKSQVEAGSSIDAFMFESGGLTGRKCTFRCDHCRNRRLSLDGFSPGDGVITVQCDCKECDEFDGWITITTDDVTITGHGDVVLERLPGVTPSGLQDPQ